MVCTCDICTLYTVILTSISQVFVLGVNFAETKLVKVRGIWIVCEEERDS